MRRKTDHNINSTITDIETRIKSKYGKYSEYVVGLLHDMYEGNRHRFFSAEEVYSLMQKDYRYHDIVETLTPFEFTQWYVEMLKLNKPTIEIGTPCTVYYYSDHRAATVTHIGYYKDKRKDAAGNLIPKRIGVNLNKDVECNDFYSGDYTVHPITDPEEMKLVKYYFTKRRNHCWVSEGSDMHDGLTLGIGYWDHYIDPSF